MDTTLQPENLRAQLERLLRERRELEEQILQTREELAQKTSDHSTLTNLFVASSRLHESIDRRDVLTGIQEIVINLLGSEELGIFELSEDGKSLRLVDHFGIRAEEYSEVPVGTGSIGDAVRSRKAVVEAQSGSPRSDGLTVAVPLMVGERVVGAVAVFRLLPQKNGLEALDHDLLDLLRSQAGIALACTRLLEKQRVPEAP